MKISVITATWNSQATIIDTLKSLAGQQYQDIEHIIVDGASTDNTLTIIEENKCEFSKVYSRKDSGIYEALNRGVSLATGDVLGFLHSDDVFAAPCALAKIAEKFLSTQCDVTYGDLEYVKKDDLSKIVRSWQSGKFSRDKLYRGWMPPHPTYYMTKKKYLQFGAFDTGLSISADYDGMLKSLMDPTLKVEYIAETLIRMRVGGASNKSIANITSKIRQDITVMRRNGIPPIRGIIGKNLSKLSQIRF